MSFNELVLDCYICGTQMNVLVPVDRKIHVEEVCCPSCKKVHYLKIQEGKYEFITEKDAQRLKWGFLKQLGGEDVKYKLGACIFSIILLTISVIVFFINMD